MMSGVAGYVGQVNIGDDSYLIGSTLYGIHTPANNEDANTQIKTLVIPGFSLASGLTIHIKFTLANTNSDPKLKIKTDTDDSNALAIPIENANGPKKWSAGSVITFTLTGTSSSDYTWVINSSAIDGSSIQNLSLGYIDSSGAIGTSTQSSDVGIQEGDKLIIADENSSPNKWKISRSSLAFTSAVTEQNQSTQFLRSDGTWATPSYTTDTHYTATLAVGNASTDKSSEAVSASTNGVRINLVENDTVNTSLQFAGAGGITIGSTAAGKITFTGKAGTVTAITPGNGLINGTSGDSQTKITTTGTISIKAGGVTNDMLAGSILPAKLDSTATIGIGTQSIKVGSSFNLSTLLTDLGLSSALRFLGITTTDMTGGTSSTHTYTGIPNIEGKSYTPASGDVVINSTNNDEWICVSVTGSTYTWERLGSDSSYKFVQTAVSDPTVPSSGTTTSNSFISTITQDTQGVITVTKRNVPVTSVAGKTGAITLDHTDVGLGSVTNDAQIAKSIGTTKGDIIYFDGASSPKRLEIGTTGRVLTVSASGIPAWEDNASTDENVKQTPDSTSTDSFPILFSNTKTTISNVTTTTTKVNNNIYIIPKTGELHASKLYGNGANITGITTSQIAGTNNGGNKYLRQDGWKTLSIDNTSKASAVTAVSLSGGTAGTATQASVSNGVLTITVGTNTNFQTLNVTDNATQFLTAATLTESD